MALDSAGNQFVDFVWGNFPIQPSYNEGERGSGVAEVVVAADAAQNHGWSGFSVVPSGYLQGSYDVVTNNGIQATVKTIHNIATGLWSNYPEFIPNVGFQD